MSERLTWINKRSKVGTEFLRNLQFVDHTVLNETSGNLNYMTEEVNREPTSGDIDK